MASELQSQSEFVAGGAVQAGNGIYLTRPVDRELLEACRLGTYCYILTSRQMGKSSLVTHTAETLLDEGVFPVMVDLTLLGSSVSLDQWYVGFLQVVEDQLQLTRSAAAWWKEHDHLGPNQRFAGYLREVVLAGIQEQERLVIFVDEIDTTLTLEFTDDFFVAVRHLYQARANDPELNRISFVLSGVATPSDLIKDHTRTPFNIGRRIELRDFTIGESLPLLDHLGVDRSASRTILDSIFAWTSGHPYLTLRVFRSLQEKPPSNYSEHAIETRISDLFLGPAGEQDSNLAFVREKLTSSNKGVSKDDVLAAYREIYARPSPDKEQDRVISWLKLSGVVQAADSLLNVRNRIYRTVFTPAWAASHMDVNWRRLLNKYKRYILALAAALAVIIPLYAYAVKQRVEAEASLQREAQARKDANVLRWQALDERQKALNAAEAALLAEQRANKALGQTKAALREAEQQRRLAEQATAKAVNAQGVADDEARNARSSAFRAATASASAAKSAADAELSKQKAITEASNADAARVDAELSKQDAEKKQFLAEERRQATENVVHEIDDQNLKSMGKYGVAVLRNSSILDSRPTSSLILGARFDPWTHNVFSAGIGATVWNFHPTQKPPVSVSFRPERGFIIAPSPSHPGDFAVLNSNQVEIWRNGSLIRTLPNLDGNVIRIEFSRDGALLAVSLDNGLILWNNRTWNPRRLAIPSGTLTPARLSPDAKTVATLFSRRLSIHDLASGRETVSIVLPSDAEALPPDVIFSADGRFLLTYAYGNRQGAALRDAHTLKPIYIFADQIASVRSASFSPDSHHVVTAGDDGSARIWSTSTGKQTAILKPREPLTITGAHGKAWPLIPLSIQRQRPPTVAPVNAVAYSPDGAFVATGYMSGMVRIWKASGFTGGQPQVELTGHLRQILTVQFSCDQRYLLTASSDGTARIWTLKEVPGMTIASCPPIPAH